MTTEPDTFEAFKNSFSYGSRADMNFKFLKGLSEADAAQFLQDLLWKLADSLDDGNLDRLADHIVTGQQQAYDRPGSYAYGDTPFTPLSKPLSAVRIGLLTSSGHFVAGDDPQPFGIEDMTQDEAIRRIDDFLKSAPQLSHIPVDTPPENLRVRHGGYDVRAAQADPNVNLPYVLLQELANAGVFAEFAPTVYSFVGATSQLRLQKHEGPAWVELCQAQGVDAMVLVPV